MSFLKQLLTPFIEFDEDKEKGLAKQNEPPGPTSTPQIQTVSSVDENVQHPLITGSNSNVENVDIAKIPAWSPGGTIAEPLPQLFFILLCMRALKCIQVAANNI